MIPHFDAPFRIQGSSVRTNEQDSVEDVLACCYAVLVYEPGQREMVPDFGTPSLLFENIPVPKSVIKQALDVWEPRAVETITSSTDAFDALIERVGIVVSTREHA